MSEPLDQAELRKRSQRLDEAQELFKEVSYLANPKMPCPECAGGGAVSGGSLGDICLGCMGTRAIERPGPRPLEIPPFKQLRQRIRHYGDALRLGQPLPPADTVPTVEQINEMISTANDTALQLAGEPSAVERLQLNGPTGEED